MTDETAVIADSQPAGAPPSPEIAEPDGKADEGHDSPPSSKDDSDLTANGEPLEQTRTQRNWRALREDRDHWRDVARDLISRQQPPPQRAPERAEPEVSKAKTLADFDYDEAKYQAYLREDVVKTARETLRSEIRQQQEQERAQRRQSQFVQREQEFSKTVDDYREVTRNPRLPITEHIAEVVGESEEGPALAYFLGKNLDIAERLAQMPPLAAARELGRIEARLIAEREKAKEKPVVSKAPPPTPKIDASEPGIEKDPDQMSTDDWLKWREKQVKKRK